MNDISEVIGLDQDLFPNDDKMLLHLDELIKARLGGAMFACLKPEIGEIGGKKFLAVECKRSKQPVFLKMGNDEVFHIRASASSPALPGKQALDYIAQHFKSFGVRCFIATFSLAFQVILSLEARLLDEILESKG